MIITKKTEVRGAKANRHTIEKCDVLICASKSEECETVSLTVDNGDDFLQIQVWLDLIEKIIEQIRDEYTERTYHD